jgi:Tol biopolymer transport system component
MRSVAITVSILATVAGPSSMPVLGAGIASPPPARVPTPYGPAANGSFAYAADGDIWLADAEGARGVAITSGPANDSRPSFSRDGTRVAFLREEGGQYPKLMVARSDGSDLVELATGTDHFDWSPTGDRLLANHDVDARPSLSIVEADGSGIRTLEPTGITPTGHALWRPTGGDEVIFTGHPQAAGSDLGLYAIHPDGTGLRTVGPVSATESDAQQSFKDLQPSPDGSLIAYWNWESSEAGVLDGYVHVRDLDTGDDRRVAVRPLAEANVSPRFSPDGTSIVVEAQSETEELAQLVVAPVDGSRPGVVIGPDFSYMQDTEFDFSPDGASVVLTLGGVTSVVDVATGEVLRTLDAVTSFPTWQRLAPAEDSAA